MNYGKPFNLDAKAIKWVEDTLANLSVEEKIKQLFIDMAAPVPEPIVQKLVESHAYGGLRYMNQEPAKVKELLNLYKKYSKVPLIVAANTEAGGNGACVGGTEIGQELKVAATNDKKYAYELGRVSALEAKAVGCNTVFAPIVDIHNNWHNPIIATRTFGNDAKKVAEFSKEYLRACHELKVASVCKHFPGDGMDERDQHLANSINSLSCADWDKTYGYVYQEMINNGVEGIMIGHICLPSYEKYFNPNIEQDGYLPATLSPYIVSNLLREKLGFNGLIITDASHMVGMTGRMARRDIVPTSIKIGCDMFLFYNDFEEDINYVKKALDSGYLSMERLDEAVRRILAFKAHLGLHEGYQDLDLSNIGLLENKNIAREVADKAITLVKYKDQGVLPLTSKKYKNILLLHHDISNPFNSYITNKNSKKYYEIVADELTKAGFNVEIYTPVLEQLKKASDDEVRTIMNKLYTSKSAISTITDKYDLIIHLANVPGNGVVQRIDFALTKGAIDIPWYVHELPVIFISVNCPFHLFDVPQVRTYINCYDAKDYTMASLVSKLLGESEFKGVSPVDAFCGCEDTKW